MVVGLKTRLSPCCCLDALDPIFQQLPEGDEPRLDDAALWVLDPVLAPEPVQLEVLLVLEHEGLHGPGQLHDVDAGGDELLGRLLLVDDTDLVGLVFAFVFLSVDWGWPLL